MAQMVRKQVYLSPEQDQALARAALARHATQAEVIREALRQHLEEAGTIQEERDWEEALAFMEALAAQGPLEARPRSWSRDDLYEERLSCRERHGSD